MTERGRLSGRRSLKYEASRRGLDPRVAAAPYPLRLMPGIPGNYHLPYKESYSQPEPYPHKAMMSADCVHRWIQARCCLSHGWRQPSIHQDIHWTYFPPDCLLVGLPDCRPVLPGITDLPPFLERAAEPSLAAHWVWFFPVCPSCPILPGLNLSFHA